MSRTDAHRPYWVVLNDEGTDTQHDHLRLGRPITKVRYLLDENGEPYKVIEPLYAVAHAIVGTKGEYHWGVTHHYNSVGRFIWSGNSTINEWKMAWGAYPEPVMREAHRLVNAGRGTEYVQVGTYEVWATEVITIGHVADHCTEGDKLAHRHDGWGRRNGDLPCTPSLPPGNKSGRYFARYGGQQYYENKMESGRRVKSKAMLGKMAKTWNSGEDVDDFDEVERLTDQHRHCMTWYLW